MRQPYKMVKHTQLFECVWAFCGLVLKGLMPVDYITTDYCIKYYWPISFQSFFPRIFSNDIVVVYFIQKQPTKVFYKKGFLKTLATFIWKRKCQSLSFNKVVGLRPAILLKRDTGTCIFLWNLSKFLRKLFLQNTNSNDCLCTLQSSFMNTYTMVTCVIYHEM